MNILVTLNANYIRPLKVMLKSLFLSNPEESFSIFLMHSSISEQELDDLNSYIMMNGSQLLAIRIEDSYFRNAPVISYYSKEMYYRLLAFKFLPQELNRILYLDPDTLVINPIKELYEMDIRDYLYAAAYHDMICVQKINKLRLQPYGIEAYYNSGVLLMNLELQRWAVKEHSIYQFAEKNKLKLMAPDQDILNVLYSKRIKSLDERLYNYDTRYYSYYKIASHGNCDIDYIISNTVILHFCGKRKPWNKKYNGKFHALYKHYEKLAGIGIGVPQSDICPAVDVN